MARAQWIPEAEAAKKMNYRPETLRKKVKAGKLSIAFSTISGRNYFYNELDIQKVLDNHSTLTGSDRKR